MKRLFFYVGIFLLTMACSGCSLDLAESKSENEAAITLSLEETEESVLQTEADFSRGDLLTMFESVNNEEVENFIYDDYNKDGIHEAFVLTKEENYHKLWYLHSKECQNICDRLENLEQLETDILTFPTKDYLLLQQTEDGKRNTLVYSIDNDNQVQEADISQKGYISMTPSGEIWLQTYRENEREDRASLEVQTYYLSYAYDEGFREYGAIPIGKEQFLEFDGAQEILDDISEKYPGYEIEYSFLYRANHYININITLLKDGVIEYRNLTLNYDDSSVTCASEDLAVGKTEVAYMLDIATFPTAFKHPKRDMNKQENGG